MAEKIFYTNLHTHTPLCRHAVGRGEDFCRQLPEEVRCIGFADHMPFPDGRYGLSSMSYAQLPEYFAYIQKARRKFPDIEIIAGLEAEWCPELGKDFYEEHYFSRGIKYLIGSAHYSAFNNAHFYHYDTSDAAIVRGFVDRTLEMMECGIFLYIAHPDAYLLPFKQLSNDLKSGFTDIIQAAKNLDVPLEFNCNGIRGGRQYPSILFWELTAEYGVRTVIGSDAHQPDDLYDRSWQRSVKILSGLGLTPCNEELVSDLV